MKTTNRPDYANTSAADDYLDPDEAEVVWTDEDEGSWLDDFRFDDYRSTDTSLDSIWNRYSRGSTDDAERIVTAQKMVQGIVDTFATGDKPYRVTFVNDGTAATSFAERKIVVTHKPLFDRSLTTEQANLIMTAMAAHESAHVRYGREGFAAIRRMNSAAASTLSNILGDVHDEGKFTADYPGFGSDLFAPATEYIAKTNLRDNPTSVRNGKLDPSKVTPIGLAGSAIRYDEFVDWDDATQAERTWWRDWASRWSVLDRPIDHVRGVEEGLAHLASLPEKVQEQPDQPASNDTESPASGSGESQPDQTGDDESESESDQGQPDLSDGFPTCLGEGVASAAEENADADAPSENSAEQVVSEARSLVDEPTTGTRGDIHLAPQPLRRGTYATTQPDASASAAIRAAFARSRTGHFGAERGTRTGRLDNRSLTRIASNDYRIFCKRTAPSEGRYLVWTLVDCSSSMRGTPIIDAAHVSASLAAAVRFMPNVTLDVWGWGSGQMNQSSFSATRVYHSGDEVAKIGTLINLVGGGTPDAEVISWAGRAIKAAAPRGTHPVLIIASDGEGTLNARGSTWDATTATRTLSDEGRQIIDAIRKTGVQVVSVALGDLDEDRQREMYGRDATITWAGSIRATAKPLGALVARIAAGR